MNRELKEEAASQRGRIEPTGPETLASRSRPSSRSETSRPRTILLFSRLMPLEAGTRLGPYEVISPLGAGGMGEVYRARDIRLGRDVAIKVLPAHLSSDPTRRERFEREAKAVSSLNHPHICALYDIGTQGGIDFLVMEHVEGETLAARLVKGPVPLDQALRYAIEIADALDKAHRQGVVHRDLKPANVMVTKSGAKLLDFGLAKLRDGDDTNPGRGPGDLATGSILATTTRNLTAEGTILGTFQYMAPEQLEGNEADTRTDIFAFGVLVYEMITGRKAFEGNSQASLIASIMGKDPPPIATLLPMTPASLDRIVRRCLEKDPDDRWQSARDLMHDLRWVKESAGGSATGMAIPADELARAAAQAGTQAGTPTGTRIARRRGVNPWIAAAAAVIVGAAMLALGFSMRPESVSPTLRSSLMLPAKARLDGVNSPLAFSPDGRLLAFIATAPTGKLMLWVRPLDSMEAQPLAGTEGATYPFWSPDSRFIGFFSERKLRKVPAAGGAVLALCDAQEGRGATWTRSGVIVFAGEALGGLSQVPEAGGSPAILTTTAGENLTHRLPHALPDGRRVLFFIGSAGGGNKNNGISCLDLDTKKITPVAKENSEGVYVAPGYLVFVRESNLMAQRIDPGTLKLHGEAAPIAEKVRFNPARWTGSYALSDTGLLLYQGGGVVQKGQLTWFGLDGKNLGTVAEPATIWRMHLSPDGRRAAVAVIGSSGLSDIWIYDLTRGIGSRFTFGPDPSVFPVWSPDSRRLIYGDGTGQLFVKEVDGASEAQKLVADTSVARNPVSWSPDGKNVLFRIQTGPSGPDLWILPIEGDHTPRPFLATPASEASGAFSPDGHWVAFLSDESGRSELYVVPFPGPGGKWQISSGGAEKFDWIGNGHQVAYMSPDNKLVAVDIVARGANLEIGATHPLLGGKPAPFNLAPVQDRIGFAPDGRRILVAVTNEEEVAPPMILVTNWSGALEPR